MAIQAGFFFFLSFFHFCDIEILANVFKKISKVS
jgi:hypothetical protein